MLRSVTPLSRSFPGSAPASPGGHEDAGLTALGLASGDDRTGELRAACARIAHRLHRERLRVVGFIPCDDRAAVPPLIVQLGLALAELTGATIAVVDANVRYPAFAGAFPGGPERGAAAASGVFATRWLHGSLAVLTPRRAERAGEVAPQLARALDAGAELFAHVLVDLTGFELLGEHAAAAACMDAVVLVGRAHGSRERELLELARLVPKRRLLGVVLVG